MVAKGKDSVLSAEEYLELVAETEPSMAEQGAFMAGVVFGRLIETFHRATALQFQLRTGLRFPQSAAINIWMRHAQVLVTMLEQMGQDPVHIWRLASGAETAWAYRPESEAAVVQDPQVKAAWEVPHTERSCVYAPTHMDAIVELLDPQ